MSVEEAPRSIDNFSKILEQLASALPVPIPKIYDLQLSNVISSVSICLDIIENLNLFLSDIQSRILEIYPKVNYQSINKVLSFFGQISSDLIDVPFFNQAIPYLAKTMKKVEPYLPSDKKEEYQNIVLPKLQSKHRLSLSELLSILNLLVAIFFGVIASMPDEQTERIIAQNETMIEQQAEIIQLQKEDQALVDVLDSLSDSINVLTDEIDSLREDLEASGNSSDDYGNPDPEDPQQQNGNAQD